MSAFWRSRLVGFLREDCDVINSRKKGPSGLLGCKFSSGFHLFGFKFTSARNLCKVVFHENLLWFGTEVDKLLLTCWGLDSSFADRFELE